jgi:hypothetical protein
MLPRRTAPAMATMNYALACGNVKAVLWDDMKEIRPVGGIRAAVSGRPSGGSRGMASKLCQIAPVKDALAVTRLDHCADHLYDRETAVRCYSELGFASAASRRVS